MDKDILKEIVADRQNKCEQGHIIIDVDMSMVKGYTKAGRIQKNKGTNGLSSGNNLFNQLGIDYCGN